MPRLFTTVKLTSGLTPQQAHAALSWLEDNVSEIRLVDGTVWNPAEDGTYIGDFVLNVLTARGDKPIKYKVTEDEREWLAETFGKDYKDAYRQRNG